MHKAGVVLFRSFAGWALGLMLAACPHGSGMVYGAEAEPDPANRLEVRLGAFAHGVGGVERNTVSLEAELVSPRVVAVAGAWAPLVPRFSLGGSVNLAGKTDYAYANILWTVPVFDRAFAELFVGPAVHNGSLDHEADRVGLGCPVLFHAGGSVGYRLTERISLMGTFAHLSNGRSLFGVDCGTNLGPRRNQGLNNYGLRLGFAF